MIISFKDSGSENVALGRNTKKARRVLPPMLHQLARRRLASLNSAESLIDLSNLQGNCLETLVGDRHGQYSVRINAQYRICFRWVDDNALDVEIVDYHK